MIEPLLSLPANLRSRLGRALASETLGPPYTKAGIRAALGTTGGYDAANVAAALNSLDAQAVGGPAVALALDIAARSETATVRPDLVWSGPAAPGIHTRGTRQVYQELIATAEREIWISTYAYFDGQQAFRSLANRMEAVPGLQVRLLLNIPRKHGDAAPAETLITDFAIKLWRHDWPSAARPDVYYDPPSIQQMVFTACCTPKPSSSTIRPPYYVRKSHRGRVRPQHRGRNCHS